MSDNISVNKYFTNLYYEIKEYFKGIFGVINYVYSLQDLSPSIDLSTAEGVDLVARNPQYLTELDNYGDSDESMEGDLVTQMLLKILDICYFFSDKSFEDKVMALERMAMFLSLFNCSACLFHDDRFFSALSQLRNALNRIILSPNENPQVVQFAMLIQHGCTDDFKFPLLQQIAHVNVESIEDVRYDYIEKSMIGNDPAYHLLTLFDEM